MSDGQKPIVLLCWETAELGADDWCHRALISMWLQARLGMEVFEFGYELAAAWAPTSEIASAASSSPHRDRMTER